mgnify:CR=1 FL=1
MNIKILLIGCGNIGFRHLEGLLKTDLSLDISIIEISKARIKEQIKKIKKKKFKNKKIFFSSCFSIKRLKFDLVICATTAYKRYNLLKKLVSRYYFPKVLIEKVAFQNTYDFEKALQLFKKEKIQCWVNCPRREYKIYKQIKMENKIIDRMSIDVSGNKWNLASNSVHIFDLFYFLVNIPVNFSKKKVDLKKIPSKHNKFFELYGKLKIKNEKYNISMSNQRKSNGFIIKIKTPKTKYYIDEIKNFVRVNSNNKTYTKKINIPLQSQCTKSLIKKIIYDEKILLPTLSEAYLSHKLLYSSFKKFLYIKKGESLNRLIT